MDREQQINTFTRFFRVSRETTKSLEKYEKLLINSNKSMNLVGNSTIRDIWHRHILDSFQVIDFIDKNYKTLIDLGTGAGLPGLILAIAAKDRNMNLKVDLVEKSLKKTKFLREAIKKLDLKVNVICKNVFDDKKIMGEVFVARAFKPLSIILELIHNKGENWKKIFIFLGKSGKSQLLHASKSWDIEYKQRMSITNNDSFFVEITKLEKKN